MKDEKSDAVAHSHSIMDRRVNHFSLLLDVHMGLLALDRQEIHIAEPLVPELSVFDVELAIEKLKSHKLPGIDHISAELIKAGGRTIRYEIHKLISIWNSEELPEEWKESVFVPIYRCGRNSEAL